MTRMAGQQPIAVVDGRPITLADLKAAYASKNHIVDGGPEVGLFWASNISTTDFFNRKPIEHGLRAIADHARHLSGQLDAVDYLDSRGPWILPSQLTQHQRGGAELDWQYPFQREDLVDAKLLPPMRPGLPSRAVPLPSGMSVLEAIKAGVIR